MSAFEIVPVAPTGKRETHAFVHRSNGSGGMEAIHVFEYPPSPNGEALRAARIAADVSLRDLAIEIGAPPKDVSALETGRATLASEAEWKRLLDVVSSLGTTP